MSSDRVKKVLRRIEERAWSRWIGIVGPRKGRVLVDLVRRHRPRRVLEVGTAVGYSAILMGKELGEGAEIVTIEIDEGLARRAEENIEEAGLSSVIRVVVGDALEVIPRLEGEFDLVFLDADKGEYLDYLRLVEDKIHRGSVIVADNVCARTYGMRRYLNYVRNSGRYESRFIRFGWDGMEVSVKL
ncbi:O-methyltransferase [Candidatus Bathyarchaeota archaeon]|nr:O-methyltransferase [Candidatus Bathyarchaeota archaeon]